jgi:hypothetical protein
MGTTEIVGISIFGLLLLGAVALGLWQGTKQRERVARYSSGHGFSVLRAGDARLAALLEQVAPDSRFSPHPVMLVEPAPNGVYLFGCQIRSKERSSTSSTGYACLAEHAANRPEWPVTIFTRTPIVEKLVRDRVETGGEEFRRKFTVTCSNAGVALVTVSVEVQRIFLDHAAGPGWYLSVTIAGRGVLVESHWAQTEEEWDYLIALAKKLRAALR